MPFFYDETEVVWPEDGSDPPLPRADQFIYLTAASYNGVPDPIRFSIQPLDKPDPLPDVQSLPEFPSPAPPPSKRRPGILVRLLDRLRPSSPEERLRRADEKTMRLHIQQRQRLLATMVPALRQIAIRRVYCRYEGGNDEGFSWIDRFETDDGTRIDREIINQRLRDIQVRDKLYAAGIINRATFKRFAPHGASDQEPEKVNGLAMDWLCDEWACILLGGSFGGGQYSMFGAFTVDLETCTIADDPNADPIVKHIQISS